VIALQTRQVLAHDHLHAQTQATFLDGVDFAYNDKPVLRQLCFRVQPGEILGLLGSNGAGKTTTFHLLAGLLRPQSGRVGVAGFNPVRDGIAARQVTAFLPDEPLLYPNLSALENLVAYAVLWNVPAKTAKARAEQLLKSVGLWDFRHAWSKTYSRGMKQKLALCAALLHQPKLLLMDEPLSGLDIDASLWARDMLRQFAADGGTVILTSHAPELIDAIVDRAVILKNGRVGLDESIQTLRLRGGLIAAYQSLEQVQSR
jgi:ABC-2 type transport system ATP-binding protein